MAATLRDVAEHAQVSVRTVSNVVSGYAHVSEKMRRRVLTAIEELDYRPNPVARTLRTGRTGVLALVVPEIDLPYFAELAREIINAAAEHGYRVMVDQTGHDHERERELLTGADRTMLFDGVLFTPLVTRAELLEMQPATTMPLVLLGEHQFDGRYDHVAIDNVQAAQDAVAHLLARGRTRVAAIGAQPEESYATPQQRTPATSGRCAPPACPSSPRCCGPPPTTAARTATTPPRRCCGCRTGPTRSSATPTCSPWARCARCSTPACASPRTSPSSASTTSRRAATPGPR